MSKGFTLVELLVVISILAIIATIGLISYREVHESGRDAKRKADLGTIQSALEQHHNDQHNYPQLLSFGSALTSGTKIYLNQVPTDPLNTPPNTYCYKALKSGSTCEAVAATDCDNTAVICTTYCLYSKLENGPVNLTDECSGSTNRNFRITPP